MLAWAILALIAVALGDDNVIHKRSHPSRPPFLLGRPPGGHKKTLYHHIVEKSQNLDGDYPNVHSHLFDQKLDHFNDVNTDTWKQKYYHNKQWMKNNSLIFLMIGGEGPEGPKWSGNPNVVYLQWAAKYGAEIFDLEHRFFGDSFPKDDMSFDSLKLCTTEQALADIANFIVAMNKKNGYDNPRWITFGGSYPGSLSAFFRAKYPDLTVGAVASSAPVNLKLDFYEYAMVVQDTVTITDPLCPASIQSAFDKMQKLSLSEDGRNQLNNYFHIQPPFNKDTTKLDITNFFANMYSLFQGMIQYTYDGQSVYTHSDITAQKLCNIMTDQSVTDPLVRVYNLWLWYNKFYPSSADVTVFPNDYWGMIESMSKKDVKQMDENGADRGWMWLCCNEIGFLQTTDQGRNIFGANVPLNYFIDMCTDLFGPQVKVDFIKDNNKRAQDYYKMASEATNIVLPNGSLDPWHALGTYATDSNANFHPILINGTAHCSDMYPPYDGEPKALAQVRLDIEKHLVTFMDRYQPTPTVATTAQPAQPTSVGGGSTVAPTQPTAPVISTQATGVPVSSSQAPGGSTGAPPNPSQATGGSVVPTQATGGPIIAGSTVPPAPSHPSTTAPPFSGDVTTQKSSNALSIVSICVALIFAHVIRE